MPPRRDSLRDAFNEIQTLRDAGASDNGIAKLRTVIRKKNGMIVSRAAPVVAEWFETSLAEDLEACFYRLNKNGVEDDPQCWGKTAIIKALHELSWQDNSIYEAGCRTMQLEPVRGGKEDTAVALRIASLTALMQAPILDTQLLMTVLSDLLADESRRVREEAAKLSTYAPPALATPLLRLKIQLGDTSSRVLGNCFDALLSLMPTRDSIQLIHRFTHNDAAIQAEALASLASSSLPEAINLVSKDYEQLVDSQLRRIILTSFSLSPTEEALAFLFTQLKEPLPEASWAFEALKSKLHDEEIRNSVLNNLEERGDDLIDQFYQWQNSRF